MTDYDVVVIGAGPAGLCVGQHLVGENLAFVILDRSTVGSTWQEQRCGTRLNSLRTLSGLPGMPIPKLLGSYPLALDFARYLKGYAAKLSLPVRENCGVTDVLREGAGWRVRTREGEFTARVVVAATGTWGSPFFPAVPGVGKFTGLEQHSRDCRDLSVFAGKSVMIAGAGTSGVELAIALSAIAESVVLSVRSGVNLVPRPRSAVLVRLVTALLNSRQTSSVARFVVRLLRRSYEDIGLVLHPAARRDPAFRPVVGTEIVSEVRSGRLALCEGVTRVEGGGIELSDGSWHRPDALIWATGFRPNLGLYRGYVDTDDNGYPVLSGSSSAREPLLFLVGFNEHVEQKWGWLRSIGERANACAVQVLETLRKDRYPWLALVQAIYRR